MAGITSSQMLAALGVATAVPLAISLPFSI